MSCLAQICMWGFPKSQVIAPVLLFTLAKVNCVIGFHFFLDSQVCEPNFIWSQINKVYNLGQVVCVIFIYGSKFRVIYDVVDCRNSIWKHFRRLLEDIIFSKLIHHWVKNLETKDVENTNKIFTALHKILRIEKTEPASFFGSGIVSFTGAPKVLGGLRLASWILLPFL